MRRIRLYIADMDESFVAKLRHTLHGSLSTEVVGNTGSGREALREVCRLLPDVLITDISLPELDGIALLREIGKLRRPPAVIVCTRFYSQASMDCACRFGASFFLCKPVEMSSLPRLIDECAPDRSEAAAAFDRQPDPQDRESRGAAVRELLTCIGLSPKLSGSAYLIEAVMRCQEDDVLLRNLSRGLYVELAGRMGTTVSRIERSLRNAIAIAYERGSLSDRFSHRPSNREFIEYLLSESGHANARAHLQDARPCSGLLSTRATNNEDIW